MPGRGCRSQIPAEAEGRLSCADLIEAGFTHIDAVSFVSPAAVPQMADSERVLEFLDPPEDVEIIGIVVNEKGAERAIRTGAVDSGFSLFDLRRVSPPQSASNAGRIAA